MTCRRLTGLAWMAYWAALTPLVVAIAAIDERRAIRMTCR